MSLVKSPEIIASDSNLLRLQRLTNTLMKVRQGGLTQKDVKNEGRSGDVYENKGSMDKMY